MLYRTRPPGPTERFLVIYRRVDTPILGFKAGSVVGKVLVLELGSGTSASAVLVRPVVDGAARAGGFVGNTDDRRALFRVDCVVPALLAFRGELLCGAD